MNEPTLIAKVDHQGVVTVYDPLYMPMVNIKVKNPKIVGLKDYKNLTVFTQQRVDRVRALQEENAKMKLKLKLAEQKILKVWWHNLDKMFNVLHT